MRFPGTAALTLVLAVGLVACSPPGAPPGASPSPSTGATPTLRELSGTAGIAFGTAINVGLLDDPVYAGIASSQFGSVTAENAMKWAEIEPTRGTYDWTAADRLVDFAIANGQSVRGHTLIWHNQTPAWLEGAAAAMTDAEFADLVKKHVQDEVGHFKGKIWQWDVVNEALDDGGAPRDTIFRQRLGPDYIAQVFTWAHEADPAALLFYNDYGIEDGNSKTDAVLALVKDLKARGVPIDGVGFQAHYDTAYLVPSSLPDVMKSFTDAGLKVAVTEMDVRGDGSADKVAKYYTTTLDACRGNPGCLSFTVWGISDKDSWIPQAFPGKTPYCLYDAAYRPNPWFADVAAALS